MTLKYAIIRKRCLNYTACLTVIRLLCAFAHIRLLNSAENLRPAQRYDDFELIRIEWIAVKQMKIEIFYMVPYLQIFAPGAALWWF